MLGQKELTRQAWETTGSIQSRRGHCRLEKDAPSPAGGKDDQQTDFIRTGPFTALCWKLLRVNTHIRIPALSVGMAPCALGTVTKCAACPTMHCSPGFRAPQSQPVSLSLSACTMFFCPKGGFYLSPSEGTLLIQGLTCVTLWPFAQPWQTGTPETKTDSAHAHTESEQGWIQTLQGLTCCEHREVRVPPQAGFLFCRMRLLSFIIAGVPQP